MKAKPYHYDGKAYVPCTPAEADHVALHMEGHWPNRMMPVGRQSPHFPPGPVWQWNGDTERPSLTPSILVKGSREPTDAEVDAALSGGPKLKPERWVCHIYVTDGLVQYLGDCTHEHAGTTRPLLDVPE